ncbi:4'-phosphopantetheinyl transferase superfamily protein [Mycoplasmopsis iners]|uniref:4'-phosphopantetheinyl transferase superfamily protein n=1 Tax=Mycoplasmopsis iners TaxID=76630 RepID=UPI000A92D5D1|nr:4'-phosphopantetheinyl transferase superfamily protein [Mycoplasmopsis iners]
MAKISRFANKDKGFIERILHPNEIKYLESVPESLKTQTLASLWAIKEAIYKANNDYSFYSNYELKRIDHQWKHEKFAISLTHEDDYVVAVAIEKKE